MADVRIHDLPSAASWNGFFPQDKPGGPTECVSVATVEARLELDGFVKTAMLVAGYQPLENQRVSTTDSPTFAGLLLSGATANKLVRFNASKNLVAYDLVASDIPALDTAKITTGTFADARISSAATWNAKLTTVTADATSRVANTFYAAPNGAAGAATFRAIVAADLPTLSFLPLAGGDVSGTIRSTVSGFQTWTTAVLVSSTNPSILLQNTGNTADGRIWRIRATGAAQFTISSSDDTESAALNAISFSRSEGVLTARILTAGGSGTIILGGTLTTDLPTGFVRSTAGTLASSALIAADIPSLDTAKVTTGTFADARIASAATWNAKLSPSAVSGVTGNIAIFSGANSVSDNTGLFFDGTGLWCDGYIHGGGFKVGGSNFVDASRNIINGGSGTFSGALWGYGLRSTGNVTVDTGYALVMDSITRIGPTGIGNLLKLQIAGVDRITNAGGFVGTSLQLSGATASTMAKFDGSKNLVSAVAGTDYLAPHAVGANIILKSNGTGGFSASPITDDGSKVVFSIPLQVGGMVAKAYPPAPTYWSLWGDAAVAPNYSFVASRDGVETYVGARTKVALALGDTEKLIVTASAVNIIGNLQIGGVTRISSGGAFTGTSALFSGLAGSGTRLVTADASGNLGNSNEISLANGLSLRDSGGLESFRIYPDGNFTIKRAVYSNITNISGSFTILGSETPVVVVTGSGVTMTLPAVAGTGQVLKLLNNISDASCTISILTGSRLYYNGSVITGPATVTWNRLKPVSLVSLGSYNGWVIYGSLT